MLYTTIPIPKQQISSSAFQTRKIGDEFPAPVFESRVSIMSAHTSMKLTVFFQYLWAVTAARLLSKPVSITTFVNALASTQNVDTFLTLPSLIVSFREYNEKVLNLISELGFSRQSSGRYKYVKGPASDAAITRLLKEGASSDAYSMMGSCNIKGYTCFTIINRLLHASLPFLCLPEDVLPELWNVAIVNKDIVDLGKEYIVKNASQLPSNGIIFPYFDGMALPDKANTPRIILHLFSKCMGQKAADLMTAARIIQEGWPSLSTTSTGIIISHVVFGISLALSGARIHIITIGGVYNGFILSGSKFTLFKGGVEHKLLKQEELKEEFEKLDEHDAAILDLSEIISSAPLHGTQDLREVLPEHLQSARRIHYAIRIRKFDSTEVSRIASKMLKLHFRQDFWDRSDDGKIAQAIGSLLAGELLPVEAPYALNSGHIFSDDITTSTLAAFGDKSISLIGEGNNTVVALAKTKKSYEATDGLKLEGIPIFFKPLMVCVEDWSQVRKTGLVTMKAGAKDKKGNSKVAGLGTYVTFSSPAYDRIWAHLSTHVAQKIGKRKDRGSREEESDGLGKEPDARKVKKLRGENEEILGLLGPGPELPEAAGEQVGDMDIDPFA